ncbi:uncharacterized protein [Diabrotica undecimpunctata]|uniref:uncharacterized protein n=1 Tax=Diabrotica undecimpunctata TaxID=50387 RepID=UPI003B635FE7
MASELSSSESEPFQDSSSDFIPDSESSEENAVNEVAASNVATTSGLVENKKSKKRSREPNMWKRNQRKLRRSKGEEYINVKGNIVERRSRGGPCQCRFKCFEGISEETLDKIFTSFYEIGDKEQQDIYLGGLIQTRNVDRRRPKGGGGVPRGQTFLYKIKRGIFEKKVCKTAFMNIHAITKSRVERIATHMASQIVGPKDMRGRHETRPNKIPDQIIKSIEDHINSFPRRKSHYSRNDNLNRRYLSSELNLRLMHRLYLKKYEPEQHNLLDTPEFKPKVSYTYYRRVFVENFNLTFGHPRTDTCKTCDILDNKIKCAKDDETQNTLKVEKKVHLTKADTFYKDLTEKTALAKEDPRVEVMSFDFEQNMPLPHVPSGDVFYKRQLWFYPFCIHKGSVSKSYFYVFDEITGRKSPNEVISCLHDFINNYIDPQVTTLYVYSDNCAAQNKNSVLVHFWQSLLLHGRFKRIRHRYPEPGHSFLPCDRSFALVEKEKRKKERVYLPEEWSRMIANTSKKFIVKTVKQDMILNYKEVLEPFFKKSNIKNSFGAKFTISKYKVIEFSDTHRETVTCSESANGFVTEDFVLLKKSCVPIFPQVHNKVYNAPLPLKRDKLLNVMELARQYVGEAEMWYYQQLVPVKPEECQTSETEDEH